MPASKRQGNARPDNEQMEPLELWGYECSPFVRTVREKLCALALPHVMVSCSRGSANRDLLVKKTGRFQVPFLVDPNTGLELFESPEICDYLDAVYTVKTPTE
jgi:glutathione S-transferase